jgi:transcription initiation factor TFIID subunit 6
MNRVQPNARATLVTLVEAHIRNVLSEAISVSRHCKRARVYQPPSNASLGGLNGEDDPEEEYDEEARGVGGLGEDAGGDTEAAAGGGRGHRRSSSSEFARPVIKRRIHAADINMALQLMGSEKLYSTRATPALGGTHGDNNPSQSKVMLVDFLRDEPIGQPPSEVGIQQHWLAVDGVQPRIPQNPSSRDATVLAPPPAAATGASAPSAAGGADSGAGEALQVNQLQTSLLSEELLLYYTRVTRVLYLFDRPSQQDAVLLRLSTDPGLQELVPFLIRYCQHELYRAVAASEWDKGRILVRLAHAMLQNVHLHLELHLHEVLPALVTCVVNQQPNDQMSSTSASMWALKREAADVLAEACRAFGAEYATLKSRVLKALCRAMAADRHLTSRYGGIVGLSAFGTKAISAFLLPPAAVWFEDFDAALFDPSDPLTESDKFSVRMCQRAILDAVGAVLRGHVNSVPVGEMRELLEVTGDRWVVFGTCSNDGYAGCFI